MPFEKENRGYDGGIAKNIKNEQKYFGRMWIYSM
jgi:hypothetical protein